MEEVRAAAGQQKKVKKGRRVGMRDLDRRLMAFNVG